MASHRASRAARLKWSPFAVTDAPATGTWARSVALGRALAIATVVNPMDDAAVVILTTLVLIARVELVVEDAGSRTTRGPFEAVTVFPPITRTTFD